MKQEGTPLTSAQTVFARRCAQTDLCIHLGSKVQKITSNCYTQSYIMLY